MCGETKPYPAFNTHSRHADGYTSACRACVNDRRVARRIERGERRPDPPAGYKWCGKCEQDLPLPDFYHRRSGAQAGKPHAHCIPCTKADNVARARARGVQPRRSADPLWWRRHVLARHRMTVEQYEILLANSGSVCPGCGITEEENGASFAVDHDHDCCPYGDGSCGSCVRGLLCRHCNFTVGHARDDPRVLRRLADYLDRAGSASLGA